MFNRFTFSLLLMFVTSTGLAANYTDPSKPIVISKSKPEFTIVLKSNRTTGFSWFLSPIQQTLFEIKSHRYERTEDAAIGEGGYEYWEFKTKAAAFEVPMILNIGFAYLRSWELKDAEPVQFTVLTSD
mgnify:CR=1 FL=1